MLSKYLNKRGFTDDIISVFYLKDEHERGIVIIPYHSMQGEPLYERINNYNNKYSCKMKYVSPKTEKMPGEHSWFFGLHKFKDKEIKNLVIIEGEYNCMSLWQLGIPSIGIAGQTITFNPVMLLQIPDSIEKICFLYDEYEFALKRALELEQYYKDRKEIYKDGKEIFVARFQNHF